MAQVKLLAHITVEVDDAEAVAWEMPERCAPTAVRRVLQKALKEHREVSVPQSPAIGTIDIHGLIVEWTGDHALRVVSQIQQGEQTAQELGLGSLDRRPRRGRSKAPISDTSG